MKFIDVTLSGDGRVRFVGDTHERDSLRTEGKFQPSVIAAYLGDDCMETAEYGVEFLQRLRRSDDQPGSELHFTADEDGTTVQRSSRPILSIPCGLADLKGLRRALDAIVPPKEVK